MRLISKCFKALTCKSTTKLVWGSNYLFGVSFACIKTSFATSQSSSSSCPTWQFNKPHYHISAGEWDRRDISDKYSATVGQITHFFQVLSKWPIRKELLLNPQRENYRYWHVTACCPLPGHSVSDNLNGVLLAQKPIWEATNVFPGLPNSYSTAFIRLLHFLGTTHVSLWIGSLASIFPHFGQRKCIVSTKLPVKYNKVSPGSDLKMHFLQVTSITKSGLYYNIWKGRG